MLENLQYPIGKWASQSVYTPDMIEAYITDIQSLPKSLEALVYGLSEDQVKWNYRPGGWSILQVCHHLADSHMNAYIRHKLTMTQPIPTINPYLEKEWAVMQDVFDVGIKDSVQLLKLLHKRWTIYLTSLKFEDLSRTYIHPEKKMEFNMYESISMYSWHSRHHLAHIELAIKNGSIS